MEPACGIPGKCAERKPGLIEHENKKPAGLPTCLRIAPRRAAQPVLSGRLAGSAGLEVDNFAPQLFRRPPRFRRLEVCRNVKFNQFRHHVLLAGNCMPLSRVLQEPPQKSQPVQAHVSLFPQSICSSSKLSATCKNPETHEELFDNMREITQVAECRALGCNKTRGFSSAQSSVTNTCGLRFTLFAIDSWITSKERQCPKDKRSRCGL